MIVRFGNLEAQYTRLKAGIDSAAARVLASGYYIGGPEVEAFELAFARDVGSLHAVGVGNGTDAIALALRAVGVGPRDEVIVPALSAYPTTVGVVQSGATPAFVDVQRESGLIDPAAANAAVGPRTRAIIAVHLYGAAADVDALREIADRRGLLLVEDAAQGHGVTLRGTPVGNRGSVTAWSFYPTKNLGAYGDGGAVTTSSAEAAARLRRLRNYGQANRYEHVEPGVNSRLDPFQAAILGVKLEHVHQENTLRRRLGDRYDAALAGSLRVRPLSVPEGCVPNRHLYPVRVQTPELRQEFQEFLREAGIETLIHYPVAMPDQKASDPAWMGGRDFPAARALCQTLVSLPLHPDLTDIQADHLLRTVERWDGG